MNASRAAVWTFGAAVLGAWLASAASDPRPRQTTTAPAPLVPDPMDHLAADVQAQAGRLQKRLDTAPAPQAPLRNPFSFSPRAQSVPRPSREVATSMPVMPAFVEPAEPSLDLIGIAEKNAPDGVIRTAMLSNGSGDLLIVTAGQRVLGIYDVAAISHDVVELKHATTGAIRRLALR